MITEANRKKWKERDEFTERELWRMWKACKRVKEARIREKAKREIRGAFRKLLN